MSYTYEYPKVFDVTADILLIRRVRNRPHEVLLIKRGGDPFMGRWALPGGFVNVGETTLQAAVRELQEETTLTGIELKQFGAFDELGRDPRGPVLSVVYYAFVPNGLEAVARDDAAEAKWFPIYEPPLLAFDHDAILRKFRMVHV